MQIRIRRIGLSFLFFAAGIFSMQFISCNNVDNTADSNNVLKKELVLPADLKWINSGLIMEPGKRIKIELGPEAIGIPEVFISDPVPTFGHGGLIGKIGENGFPFQVGTSKYLDGNSHNYGEPLYLGRNDATDVGTLGVSYLPQDFAINIEVAETDAPGLVSPRDAAWSPNTLPIFNWDDVYNTYQYTVELSIFPDFRQLEQGVTTKVSYVHTTSSPQPDTTPAEGTAELIELSEGLHYWRIRSEFNEGRSLSPDPVWSDWSLVYVYGVELGSPLEPPVITSPAAPAKTSPGSQVTINFIAAPDPSGIVWRHWIKYANCTSIPQIDSLVDKPSKWRVFSGIYNLYDPNEPPQNYSYVTTPVLQKGQWLVRIEIRDGSDPEEKNTNFTDLFIDSGC
ncbi:MAG TPA: hypothetical protein VII00_01525 [bacterium]